MKSIYFSTVALLLLSYSSFAQKKMTFADWLSKPGVYKGMSWITNAAFKIDNKAASFSDAKQIDFNNIGKIEVYTKKEAIATFGKEEGSKGVVIVETKTLPNRNNVITINDSVKYFIEDGDTIFLSTEQKAIFTGGTDQWTKYLQKNLNAVTPVENGAPAGIYCTLIALTVNTDGSVSNVTVVYDPGYGTGNEALRLIQKSNSLWQPSMHNGKAVKSILLQQITYQVSNG